ncbi:unnamed protein product [Blepharisma stoltei]|uniref:ABC transporter n=1 Tax=Blepharisma stoltei TaxID=1481888 RepID=A0AAU9IBI0_9CILI|nr:unnamed protein product [Blepharisma stoltei]
MSDPCIITLDEPTSGLDSYNAGIVVDLLLKQAAKGRTIISTIHQPSSNVFKKFDKLMLLSEGNVVYHGPCDKSRKYFAELGYKCPRQVNPADYYMRMLHITNRHEITEEEQNKLDLFTQNYRENYVKETETKYELSQLQEIESYHPSYWVEFLELLKRSAKTAAKNRYALRLRFLMALVIGVLLAIIFNDLGNGQEAIQNINGVLYMLSIWSVMSGNSSVVLNCNGYLDHMERAVILKESDEGLYGAWSYFLAKNIVDIPWTFIAGILTGVVSYFSLDLNLYDGSKFVIFCNFYADFIYVLSLQMGMGFGYATGFMFSTVEAAHAFSTVVLFPLTEFGGENVKIDSIPLAWRWVTYITPFKWTFQAFTVNEYTDWEKDCETECDPIGDLGWSDELWQGIIGILVISACVRLISYFILKLQTRSKST